MGSKSIRIRNGELKLIEDMLMSCNTDQEIMKTIGMPKTTFYRYKTRIYREHSERFTEQRFDNVAFYKEQLHTRLTKYLRILEDRLASCDSRDTAALAQITVDVSRAIFDLNLQGLERPWLLSLVLVTLRSFPSFHLNSLRSYMNVSIVLIDELAYLPSKEQNELMNVINAYREKSDAKIIFVTTPASPDDLAASINDDPNSTFFKLRLGYQTGLDTMYTKEAILEQMKESSFEREYNLKFTGLQGNAFSTQDIDNAITDAYSYTDYTSRDETIARSAGVDIGAGSSQTGIVITQYVNKNIQVIYAKQFTRPMLSDILEEIVRLTNVHCNCRVFIDASNPLATSELKYLMRDFDAQTYASDRRYVNDINQIFDNRLKVFPVNFLKTHKPMLSHVNEILQANKLQIHKDFKELILSLRTAYVKSDVWDLDKGKTLNDDLLDALRLALINYRKPVQRVSAGYNSPIMVSLGGDNY